MKRTAISLMISLFTFISCNAQTAYQSVEVADFNKAIADNNIVRLDVRSAEEYATGHIEGAINIDVRKPDFEAQSLQTLPKEKTIALYCRTGNRSKMAADILAKKGYQLIELDNGIMGWSRAGQPVTKEEVDLFTTPKGTLVKMHCIKHGTVRMQIGDKWIYVDPVISAVQPTTDFTAMPKADYILITHEHFDHLDSVAIRQLTQEGTQLIINPRSSEILGGAGDVMKNGDKKKLEKNWSISAVPAYNTSADKQQFHPKGRDNGYVLTVEGMNIYIAGDTEDIEEMKKLKGIDVAFLPCNLPYTMTPEQLAKAAKTIKPKVLFPYHYGQTDIQQVVKLLEGSGIEVRIRQYQ